MNEFFEVCYFLVYTACVGMPFAFGKDNVFSGTGSLYNWGNVKS